MNLRRFLTLLIVSIPLRAQDIPVKEGRLTVRTDPAGTDIFLDSAKIGSSPLARIPVSPGLHRLSLFYPSSLDWNSSVMRETLAVRDGEEIEKVFEFGTLVSLSSMPSGSKVLLGGKELGVTPIFFRSATKLSGALMVEKDGFKPSIIPLNRATASAFVRLQQVGNGEAPDDVLSDNSPANGSRRWATYASAAGMVASGIVAAYFKERANNRFDLYLETRNPSYLASTRRNDRRSAVAFALTQVGFGLLTYFLLSE